MALSKTMAWPVFSREDASRVVVGNQRLKKKTAKKVLHLMFEIGAALDGSTALVKTEEPDAEFKKYRATVGKLMVEMLTGVINPICRQFPALKPKQLYSPGEAIPRTATEYRHKGSTCGRRPGPMPTPYGSATPAE